MIKSRIHSRIHSLKIYVVGATLTAKSQPVRYITEGVYEGVKLRVVATATDIVTAFPIK